MILAVHTRTLRRAALMQGCSAFALVAAAIAALASAPPAEAETLHEALTLTYQSNPKLDAERARLRATDEGVPQAKAG